MFIPLIFLGALTILGLKFDQSWKEISLTALFCALLDWALLASLPRLGLSYGSLDLSLLLIHIVRIFVLLLILFLLWRANRNARAKNLLSFVGIFLQIGILLVESYGLYVEPFQLGTTILQESAPQFLDERPLRILQISDLHVERITRREEQMLTEINALAPDIIVLTGDYVNIDYRLDAKTHADTRAVLAQLSAPYGVYAVSGSTSVDIAEAMNAIFDGLDIQILDNEIMTVPLPNDDLYLIGVTMSRNVLQDRETLTALMNTLPEEAYTLLLYHSPDIIYTAAETGVDLYLAGHTHGGQVRAPFYGAIVTASFYGKEFEMGRYSRAATTLYVSRGIGMEGLNLPRVRFLSPPELVLVELGE